MNAFEKIILWGALTLAIYAVFFQSCPKPNPRPWHPWRTSEQAADEVHWPIQANHPDGNTVAGPGPDELQHSKGW